MNSIYDKRPWLKLYPHWLPYELDIPQATALDDFEASVARRGNSPAVCYFDNEISYGELDRISSGLANAFADLGLTKGDRILVDLQNVPQFPAVTYAAWKAGAVVVPVNPMYKEKELIYFCNDSGAKIFVTLDEIAAGLDLAFLKETSVQATITSSPLDFLPREKEAPALLKGSQKKVVPGTFDMLELAGKHSDKKTDSPGLKPEDVAYLTYTSGTTGPPKGAMNTHANIAFNARVYRAALRMAEDDVVLGVAPLFHVTGEVAHLAISALVGIPLVLYYRFDPAETLRLVEHWNVTMSVASITVYIALMNHPDIGKRNLSSFEKAYSGGAPVSSAIVDQFEKLTGLYIYNAYGMTETSSPTHLVPLGLKAPVDSESGALSVGIPVPNTIVKIIDLKAGDHELSPGQVGEIVDFGPMVIPGYWNKPEETKHAIRDGWMHTGDVGKMDEDGWFYVVDRKKDMINASGFKVWPRDVEDVIYQHHAVREAAVVGVPDEYRGETVKAFVALKEGIEHAVTPEEIIAFCKSRMAAYKYPRHVEIVPEIPKTLTGKFLRRELREQGRVKDMP
jgi:long-chain acyl-CoA synthetase